MKYYSKNIIFRQNHNFTNPFSPILVPLIINMLLKTFEGKVCLFIKGAINFGKTHYMST